MIELFPNEILRNLFEYFHTEELFQIFAPLNHRFDLLVKSTSHLSFSSNRVHQVTVSYSFVSTLTIVNPIDDLFQQFSFIRRLYLNYVTEEFLRQFNSQLYPHLECLVIDRQVNPYFMPELRRRVFSNEFRRLRCCYFSRMRWETWEQSFTLRLLHVNEIDATIYQSILIACPNLIHFKWKFIGGDNSSLNFSVVHLQLKRMTIKIISEDWPWNDRQVQSYLLCVPNLEQLRLSRSITRVTKIDEDLNSYDWFSQVIAQAFPGLERFSFILYLSRCYRSELSRISRFFQGNFSRLYVNRLQYRLEVF